MKKKFKLFKKLNNQGSSLVMVIVSLAFIGILVGALLTAVGYSYKLKLQDLNARDNFYYVEQAMNEIYAGVGSNTVENMQEAYTYTVENMVQYDLATKSYTTLDDDAVQEMFTRRFISNVLSNDFIVNQAQLGDELEKFISNDTVVLDKAKLYVDTVIGDDGLVEQVVIKNVTLTRTQNYDKSIANGAYTQTISTDIVIGEPDFKVLFNAHATETPNIFGYSMVADMGVEINQTSTPLTITGNIYAAADYYNKKYNESTYVVSDGDYTVNDEDKAYNSVKFPYTGLEYDEETGEWNEKSMILNDEYSHRSVTSKKYFPGLDTDSAGNPLNTYYNAKYAADMSDGNMYYFDGVNERSMYSGLFVEDTSVSILADTVIVPGTVAVMDEAVVSIYGKDGKVSSQAELWVDNIVLGGSSDKVVDETSDTTKYAGAKLYLRANAYVKDDTELNASGATFKLNGGYYGYGDSTEKDSRVFIPSTYTEQNATYASNFQIENEDGSVENRGHYNSSAIIVNGQQSVLDLMNAKSIYLAGRSYIELSKNVELIESQTTAAPEGEEADAADVEEGNKITESYTFSPKSDDLLSDDEDDTVFLRDYKTGESISLKTNQLAYIPIMYSGMPEAVMNEDGSFAGYWVAELHVGLQESDLFEFFYPESIFDNKIPCIMQEVSGKKYYYYDFQTAFDIRSNTTLGGGFPSAQYFAAEFIEAYVAELQKEDSAIKEYLKDITDFEDLEFDAGNITLPVDAKAKVYSSGAITSKSGTNFSIVRSDDWNPTALATLLSSSKYNDGVDLSAEEAALDGSVYESAYAYSNDLEMEYNLVKWNLGHYSFATDEYTRNKNVAEIKYIKSLVENQSFGEASLTPINKFINIHNIKSDTDISPSSFSLKSGNSVWITDDTVIVTTDRTDGKVSGIIITKGDVVFDDTVKAFEGLVISGGKVYISENLMSMTASAGTCESILKECMMLPDEEAQTILSMFKGYENTVSSESDDEHEQAKTINSIDYSDVCRFSNWMKNVE